MMKLKYFVLFAALMMALALAGCSADRVDNSASPTASANAVRPDSAARNSAGIGRSDEIWSSPGIDAGNDAMQGGGAGGTNDLNNDGRPDSGTWDIGPDGNRVSDDIGRAADDLARGTDNIIQNAGDAIGDAASDAGRAMR